MSVLNVIDLSKQYLVNINQNVLSYLFRNSKNKDSNLYAINNINFNVNAGEAFAIIGRNGSGKSTLLQIIAGTLKPTTGSVKITGRVSALLELGSGFNPEFTGIENIYLSAAILGLSRADIELRLDDIISFAEIGDYIHKPVRTYSTGMLMRVAFAVAISVKPDILIIDEALSVGDILFQQKCHHRLKELLKQGVTLLVVTHDCSFVLSLCTRALWLHEGNQMFLGSASECVQRYLAAMTSLAGNKVKSLTNKQDLLDLNLNLESLNLKNINILGSSDIVITRAWIYNDLKEKSLGFQIGTWCTVQLEIKANKDLENVSGGCELRDRHGQVIFATGLRVANRAVAFLAINQFVYVRIRFQLNVSPGQYTLDLGCGAGNYDKSIGHRLINAVIIEVLSSPDDEVVHGIVRLPYQIEVK
jgi:ABC-type polysaccharide/polyol phosphate transport system ATPase subunit